MKKKEYKAREFFFSARVRGNYRKRDVGEDEEEGGENFHTNRLVKGKNGGLQRRRRRRCW